MVKGQNKKAQAAVELAVFGAILIFILGTIVRTSMGNSLTINQNFKAMRMAMLASWTDAKNGMTAHNSASILFLEDRLSPDFNKQGDIDRNVYVAQGSGSFTYEMLYPIDVGEVSLNLPIMDAYINGQHFPLTTASYVSMKELLPNLPCPLGAAGPMSTADAQQQCLADTTKTQQQCQSVAQQQCQQNQCLRSNREWVATSGTVSESQFYNIVPMPVTTAAAVANPNPTSVASTTATMTADQITQQEQLNAFLIFNQLVCEGLVTLPSSGKQWDSTLCASGIPITSPESGLPTQGTVNNSLLANAFLNNSTNADTSTSTNTSTSTTTSTNTGNFTQWYETAFSSSTLAGQTSDAEQSQLSTIEATLVNDEAPIKLFYTMIPNKGKTGTAMDQFTITPSVCSNPPCQDQALTADIQVPDANGNVGPHNQNGAMMFDLLRMGNYTSVEQQFGLPVSSCPSNSLACYIAWQWAATEGIDNNQSQTFNIWQNSSNNKEVSFSPDTSDPIIGLDAGNYQYPSYDIDGRLKMVTIYGIYQSGSGYPWVSYEDDQGGDIDTTWDNNSCTTKPGLQGDSQVLTFTKGGTYLFIKEGKLYNPESGLVVRSVNKRDTIDVIQRAIQLSNDTGRFCNGTTETPQPCIARCLMPPNCPACCPSSNPSDCVCGVVKGISFACSVPQCKMVVPGQPPDPNNPANCCVPTQANNYCNCTPQTMTGSCQAQPTLGEAASFVPQSNPVEICIYPGDKTSDGKSRNCFSKDTIAKTCFDENNNMLYVRSRIEDLRGHFWMTNTSGQLKVQK